MKIRARINELEGGREPAIDTADAEALAALADGTLTLDDIDDATLERCFQALGIQQVVDSILRAGPEPGEGQSDELAVGGELAAGRESRPSRFDRVSWAPRHAGWLLAAAAMLVVGFAALFIASRDDGAPPAPVSAERVPPEPPPTLALRWPADPPFDPGASSTWSTAGTPLPQAMPDFDRAAGGTLGGPAAARFERWRLATVIVKVQNGWGSGAIISPDGWVLTNYHVVDGVAQQAAISGAVATVEIIPARIENGRALPAPPLAARLYRADPARDLALLKLEALPPGRQAMPHFALAVGVEDGEDCFVVGSQNNGPAWWIRSGSVSQQFAFPEGLSQFAAGVGSSRSQVDRTRATVIVSDARVSSGDSGGPLLNAKGELIGITFATPANRSAGAVGWHIALPHLRGFTRALPDRPQAVPFDPWTAGLPMARLLEPELADADGDGRADSLRYRYAVPTGDRSRPDGLRAAAITVFIDFDQRAARVDESADRVPRGLWGMEDRGRFRFHVFVTARTDGLAAVGYTNGEGVVDEVRVGRAQQRAASLVWRRDAEGSWTVSKPAVPTPMLDEARIGPAHLRRLRTIAGPVVTSDAEGRGPAGSRGPNVIR